MTLQVTLESNRLYTVDEFEDLDLPKNGNRYELIDGELVVSPPPGDEHGRAAQEINRRIILFDPDNKLGQIWQATRFKIARGFGPAPDVAFMVAGHVPTVSKGAVEGIPDLAVEVWSPGDLDTREHRHRARRKIRHYQTAGVRLVWAVNPQTRTVEVYHPDQATPVAVLGVDEELDGEDVLKGFKMPVRALFGIVTRQ